MKDVYRKRSLLALGLFAAGASKTFVSGSSAYVTIGTANAIIAIVNQPQPNAYNDFISIAASLGAAFCEVALKEPRIAQFLFVTLACWNAWNTISQAEERLSAQTRTHTPARRG